MINILKIVVLAVIPALVLSLNLSLPFWLTLVSVCLAEVLLIPIIDRIKPFFNVWIHWKKILLIMVISIYIFPLFCSYKGYIVDRETKEPVEGVVVFIEFLNMGFVGTRYTTGAAEAVTDKNGYFSIPFSGWSIDPIGMIIKDNLVTIFKSGYAGGRYPGWDIFLEKDNRSSTSLIPEPNPLVWKVKSGKPYILLKKYESVKEMKMDRNRIGSVDPVGVHRDKWKHLEDEIEKEKHILRFN